jgi:hypothetical protein
MPGRLVLGLRSSKASSRICRLLGFAWTSVTEAVGVIACGVIGEAWPVRNRSAGKLASTANPMRKSSMTARKESALRGRGGVSSRGRATIDWGRASPIALGTCACEPRPTNQTRRLL